MTPEELLNTENGAIVRMTTLMKTGQTAHTATLTWKERRGDSVYFGFQPCRLPDSIDCGFGCSMLHPTPKAFGLQKLELVQTR